MTHHVYERGAQNERTSLAWTRTGLALLVAAILAARLGAERLGAAALLAGGIAGATAITVLVITRARYRAAHLALHDDRELPDGVLPGAVAAIVVVLACVEIAYALTA